MADDRIQSIAQTIYDYLKENCIGKETSVFEAFENALLGKILIPIDEDLWPIYEAFLKLVNKERRFVLDPGENRDCRIGLPYFCPFYFIPRGAKSPVWKIRIPYFNTGEEYYDWISELPEHSLPEPYEQYFRSLYLSTTRIGYDRPISKKQLMKALKRSQRTGQMIIIAPDEDFLPGGARADQLDGWTYHLEFIPMRDYFSQYYDDHLALGDPLPPKETWLDQILYEPNFMD